MTGRVVKPGDVPAEHEQLMAERDALKAAIERVRAQLQAMFERWERAQVADQFPSMALAEVLAALDTPSTPESPHDPLHTAIEMVLLDHADEIDGDTPDANISELADVYRQRTGWTVDQEPDEDSPESPESDDQRPWAPHQFVQSRRVCRPVCICGKGPDHETHKPAPTSPREDPIEAIAKAGPAIWDAKHRPSQESPESEETTDA